MNKAASDCLNKTYWTKKEADIASKMSYNRPFKFYKCPMCGYYHRTSKGVRRGR